MAEHRIIRPGDSANWDRAFALRPHLTCIDITSYTNAQGMIERYIDTYDDEHDTPLGISAMSAGSALREMLYECWSVEHPEDFEDAATG